MSSLTIISFWIGLWVRTSNPVALKLYITAELRITNLSVASEVVSMHLNSKVNNIKMPSFPKNYCRGTNKLCNKAAKVVNF